VKVASTSHLIVFWKSFKNKRKRVNGLAGQDLKKQR
jgi:hypothetical protein